LFHYNLLFGNLVDCPAGTSVGRVHYFLLF
jgi:hypothetical protein